MGGQGVTERTPELGADAQHVVVLLEERLGVLAELVVAAEDRVQNPLDPVVGGCRAVPATEEPWISRSPGAQRRGNAISDAAK